MRITSTLPSMSYKAFWILALDLLLQNHLLPSPSPKLQYD